MSRARTGPYATPDYFQTTKIPLCRAFQCSRHARMQIHDDDDVGGKIPNKTMSLVLLFRMRRISTDLAGPAYLVQPPSYPVKSLCVARPWSRSLGAGVKSSCSLCGEWLHERAIRSAFSRHTGRSVSKGCAVETIRRSSLSLSFLVSLSSLSKNLGEGNLSCSLGGIVSRSSRLYTDWIEQEEAAMKDETAAFGSRDHVIPRP